MNEVKDIITAYYIDATKQIVENYKSKGLRASGKFEKGLVVHVEDVGLGNFRAWIESEGHAYFMESGRAANKVQSIQQARGLGHILEQWVKDKGIDVNPYAAAWKIVREGITVPNKYNPGGVISEVITDEWFKGLIDEIKEFYIEDIKAEMPQLFKFN